MDLFEFSVSLEDLQLLGTMRIDILLYNPDDNNSPAMIVNQPIITTEGNAVVIKSQQLMVMKGIIEHPQRAGR